MKIQDVFNYPLGTEFKVLASGEYNDEYVYINKFGELEYMDGEAICMVKDFVQSEFELII